ncbi:MAG: hypothetical protein V1794_07470, partial [Candidatus Glassbacteria bacterium]
CGDRFTAHQHLDNGHFLISKLDELAGDGGQYYYFGGRHDVNYLLRTIAHSSILVLDPAETWTNLRAYKEAIGNDGGQTHAWPHHNGAAQDVKDWLAHRDVFDIADMLAFEDRGRYLYVAGDCTRSYSRNKLDYFTRQIVYLRPGTFVIFDRVKSTDPSFTKTWQLQAVKPAERKGPWLVTTNDAGGRLFVQTLLPSTPKVSLLTGKDLYSYGGENYEPEEVRGPAPECRITVSPSRPSRSDYFLHVLTATDNSAETVPQAEAKVGDKSVEVTVGDVRLSFTTETVGGRITKDGVVTELVSGVPAQ